MDLIKSTCTKSIQEIKQKSETLYKEMIDNLGNQYIRENNSINHLCNFIKYCIETKQIIKKDVILNQDEFLIKDVSIS